MILLVTGYKLLTIQEVTNTITQTVPKVMFQKHTEVTMQVLVILGTKIMLSFGRLNLMQVGQKTLQLLVGIHQSLIHQQQMMAQTRLFGDMKYLGTRLYIKATTQKVGLQLSQMTLLTLKQSLIGMVLLGYQDNIIT